MSSEDKSSVDEYQTITIPAQLYRKVAARISGSKFTSVDEWVAELVRNELEPSPFSRSAEAQVRKRLKALGYD